MKLSTCLKLSCCFLVIFFVSVQGEAFRCTTNDTVHKLETRFKHRICAFPRTLKLTETEKHFTPQSDVPVEDVRIVSTRVSLSERGAQIHTLTSDFCNAFPNLKGLLVLGAGTEEIEVDALNNCKNLEVLYLYLDDLIRIDPELLKENSKLTEINFSYNPIEEFDPDMLKYTPNLKELDLSGNQLKEFNFARMPVMEHLTNFEIDRNSLSEINQDQLIEKMPKLKRVKFCGNSNISKERVIELIEFFKTKNIEMEDCLEKEDLD